MYNDEWGGKPIKGMNNRHIDNAIAYLEKELGKEGAYKRIQYRNLLAEKRSRENQIKKQQQYSFYERLMQ